jgi:tetratricopeptide (TPR) repeat protein
MSEFDTILPPIHTLREAFTVLGRFDGFKSIQSILTEMDPFFPPSAEAYDLKSYGYFRMKKYKESAEYAQKALDAASSPEMRKAARYNLGKSCLAANYPKKAEQCFRIIKQSPPYPRELDIDLSTAYFAQGRFDESEQLLRGLEKDIESFQEETQHIIRYNLSLHEFRTGHFHRGMENLDNGRKLKIFGSHTHAYPIPMWDGTPQPGKKILCVGEGGLGDELINARFIPIIKAMGMRPSWVTGHKIGSIIKRNLPVEKTGDYKIYTTDIKGIAEYDLWTPIMSLPLTLNLDFPDLWKGKYIEPDPAYVEKWKAKIPRTNKIRVGIRWAGNPLYEHDLYRTVPLEPMYNILNESGLFEIYSLQRDEGSEEAKKYENIIDLSDQLETFEDTLAVIDQMDFVVTSCTSIAHGAGAMDKETYVMTPLMTYYIWAEGGDHSSWYSDKVTLLRREKPLEWDEPFAKLQKIINNKIKTIKGE